MGVTPIPCPLQPNQERGFLVEILNVKKLREEGVAQARRELEAATTTKEKHYSRLRLQRALRAKEALNA